MPVLLAVSASVFLSGYARADSPDPLVDKSAVWISGPTNLTLGDVLEVEVLAGYKFTDASGTRASLGQNNPLPQGLIGYLKSNAGGLGIVLAFNRVGHVKYEAPAPGSYEESLKKAKAQKGITSASWDIPPRPGPVDNSVEWAVRILSGKGDTTINYVAQVLGRQGVLTFTAIYNGATTPDDLKVLLSKVSFKNGEGYADYKQGDRVSDLTLAQIAARLGDPDPATAGAKAANIRLIALWVGVSVGAAFGIAALVVAGGRLVRAAKRLRRQLPTNSIAAAVNIPAPAVSTPASAQPASPEAKPQPAHSRNGFQPKLAPTPSTAKARNGGFAKGINGHSKSKRREFDYNRYFIDLMATVSSHGLALDSVPMNNGRQVEIADTPAVSGVNGNGHTPAPYNANSELIANQTTFIEEQRRLIQEQAKLIEEKSKLIAEKNQLLQIQRELIDNKLV